jgi:hypothetical protein
LKLTNRPSSVTGAYAVDSPEFDRKCFSPTSESFVPNLVAGADDSMACPLQVGNLRAYASRARWIRTANGSHFTAMTYPEALPSVSRLSDIHDATRGVLSAFYGGALRPTAEDNATMADAAFPAARQVLESPTPATIRVEPLSRPSSPARYANRLAAGTLKTAGAGRVPRSCTR